MRRGTRMAGFAVAAALGTGTAVAVGAGETDGVVVCADRAGGDLAPANSRLECRSGELPLTISGAAVRSAANVPLTVRGGTLRINGVPFEKGRRRVITINGVPFRRSGRTLTINGTSFRTGTLPNSLTINGNSFRKGTLPNSLTINGNSFQGGTLPNSLTINGIPITEGGQAGPAGPPGPAGPAGAPPTAQRVADPALLQVGPSATPTQLLTIPVMSSTARLLLVSGGFNVACNPCGETKNATLQLLVNDTVVVERFVETLDGAERTSMTLGETIATPATCAPCMVTVRVLVPVDSGAGATTQLDVTGRRLSYLDAGPAP